MTIEFVQGDLFESGCQALVNPVNCVGVMGKGLALQFKKRYPDYFYDYSKYCEKKFLKIGQVRPYQLPSDNPKYLISFATKGHYRERSQLGAIENGMQHLIKLIKKEHIKSIAIPALGCGEGKLEFEDVKPVIERFAEELPEVDFKVYEPLTSGIAIIELV